MSTARFPITPLQQLDEATLMEAAAARDTLGGQALIQCIEAMLAYQDREMKRDPMISDVAREDFRYRMAIVATLDWVAGLPDLLKQAIREEQLTNSQ